MSRLSGQRELEKANPARKSPSWIWILVALGVLLGAWAGYDYFSYTRKVSTLDEFAKCLSSKGFRMYGAWWCPHCEEQKESFGYAFQYVTYNECGIEGQTQSRNEQCTKAGIQHFPTWQFPDGHREEGVFPLSTLAEKSGCKLP